MEINGKLIVQRLLHYGLGQNNYIKNDTLIIKQIITMIEYAEYIGYLASAVLLISFIMKNINTLRIVNTVGCAIFILYGFLIGSIPVMVTNIAICCVNLWYLWKASRSKAD